MTLLAVYGAGGHAKVVLDTALELGFWNEIHFFDDSRDRKTEFLGHPVIGGLDDLLNASTYSDVIVAIGDNRVRLEKSSFFISKGFNLVSLVHPDAVVSRFCKIGKGVVIFAGAIINACAEIRDAVIINSCSIVEHDCVIDEGSHLSPMSALAGGVFIGECSWIGLNASVIQQIRIGKDVVIGAGSVVIKDLPDSVTAVGVPARVIKRSGASC